MPEMRVIEERPWSSTNGNGVVKSGTHFNDPQYDLSKLGFFPGKFD